MTEKELTEKFIAVMEPYFKVLTEQKCDCGKCRFDLILSCKQTNLSFIIEMKKNEKKRGAEMGKHIDQANYYRHHKYKGSHLPVLIAPGYSYREIRYVNQIHPTELEYSKDLHSDEHLHHRFNGFLGHFGVGEVRRRKYSSGDYYVFVFNALELFSCNPHDTGSKGIHEKNYLKIHKSLNKWPLSHTLRIMQHMPPIMCQSNKSSLELGMVRSNIPLSKLGRPILKRQND